VQEGRGRGVAALTGLIKGCLQKVVTARPAGTALLEEEYAVQVDRTVIKDERRKEQVRKSLRLKVGEVRGKEQVGWGGIWRTRVLGKSSIGRGKKRNPLQGRKGSLGRGKTSGES